MCVIATRKYNLIRCKKKSVYNEFAYFASLTENTTAIAIYFNKKVFSLAQTHDNLFVFYTSYLYYLYYYYIQLKCERFGYARKSCALLYFYVYCVCVWGVYCALHLFNFIYKNAITHVHSSYCIFESERATKWHLMVVQQIKCSQQLHTYIVAF